MAADILIWPKVGEVDFAWLVFFILLMLSAMLLVNLLFTRQRFKKQSLGFAYAEIIGRNFNPDEARILKRFVATLSEEERRLLVETKNWKPLRKPIYDFLLGWEGIGAETAVRIYDRLFMGGKPDHSFHIGDIQPGEICALVSGYGEELTRIMKSTDTDLLLSSPKTLLSDGTKGIPAKAYIFRPRQGGFYIPGEIVGALNQAVLFHITGKPESAGHAHLMLQEKFPVELHNWPPVQPSAGGTQSAGGLGLGGESRGSDGNPGSSSGPGGTVNLGSPPDPSDSENPVQAFSEVLKSEDGQIREEMLSLEAEIRKRFSAPPRERSKPPSIEKTGPDSETMREEKQKLINTEIFCTALKLSDRGLLFELQETDDREFWKRSELWEAKFQMPGGRYVVTKGKILPAANSKTRFILKFVGMDESERVRIYEDIKKFGGEREVLN